MTWKAFPELLLQCGQFMGIYFLSHTASMIEKSSERRMIEYDTFLHKGIIKNIGDGIELSAAMWAEVLNYFSWILKNTVTQRARSGAGTTGCPNAKE